MDTNFLNKLAEKRQKQALEAEKSRKELEDKAFQAHTSNRVIDAVNKSTQKSLKHEPKVEIKNPDLAKSQDIKTLANKLEQLNSLISGDTRWTSVSDVLNGSLSELKELLSTSKESREDNEANNFIKATQALQNAVKSIESITVESDGKLEQQLTGLINELKRVDFNPKVEPKIEVTQEAPDMSGVEQRISEIKTAIKQIKLEEKPTDLEPLVKELKTLQGEIAKVYNRPFPVQEYPTTIKVTNEDGTPIGGATSSNYESRFDTTTTANAVYLGKAVPGTSESAASWQIKKVDTSAGSVIFADDETTFSKQWSQRTTYTY